MLHIKKRISVLVTSLASLLIVTSCEDVIDPRLQEADPVLVVDAWINNRSEDQFIYLTQTQPYFNSDVPPGVSGAIITITDGNGKIYSFTEDEKIVGKYKWPYLNNERFGNIGDEFKLTIQLNGETFESFSSMGRVPSVDSITFKSDKVFGVGEEVFQAEFWATDPDGPNDTYWIKSYKNGELINKPNEINLAYDAGFSAGGLADGVVFIPPKRSAINPIDEDEDGGFLSPFQPGDSIYVEINSISLAAFNFLNEVITQTDRPGGFSELFSTPLENVSTNIINTSPEGSKVVGFFNVAAVSGKGKKFKGL